MMAEQDMPKTHHSIFILYAYSCSHLFINHHVIGVAMREAAITSLKKSFEIRLMIVETDAPNTLRIPISLVRLATASAESPSRPRHARKMAIPPAHPMISLSLASDLKKRSKSSLR